MLMDLSPENHFAAKNHAVWQVEFYPSTIGLEASEKERQT